MLSQAKKSRNSLFQGRRISGPRMDAFANFRKTLDREMMGLTKTGNGTVKKQAEALTDEDEELLWSKEDQFLQSHYSIPSFI